MHGCETDKPCCGRGFSITAAVVIACLIFVALVWQMRKYTMPVPLGAKRMEERANARKELNNAEGALHENGWVDQTKGLVRLNIDAAKELTVREWQHPAQARSNLLARVAKANYVPPPPPNPLE